MTKDIVYMTASKDDPAFDENLQHLDAQFIGEGNRAFSKLNFLNATMLISTTPGLDVFQWKRQKMLIIMCMFFTRQVIPAVIICSGLIIMMQF